MSAFSAPSTPRSRPARMLGFARNVARWGLPARSLLFGPLSLGDDLLCTAVLREARQRGQPFAMMTARPELFLGNPDPERVIPVDDDFAAGLRRLGKRVVKPYYVGAHPTDPERDVLPSRHIVAEMCVQAGITGEVTLRPYLHLSETERATGRKFPRQVTIHSTGLGAAIPYPAKEWGPTRFAEVARLLAPEAKLIQLGAAGDPPLPVDLDLRGKTRLREAGAVLAASEAFVGLEGFLTHLARAVDCPSVVVMGGRAPAGIFDYVANRNFITTPECAPCARRTGCPYEMKCMAAVAPTAVVAAVRALLAQPPVRPLAVETIRLG